MLEAGIDKINISVDGMDVGDLPRFTGFKFDFKTFVENVKWLYANKGNCEIVVKIPGELITEAQRQEFFDTFGDHCDRIFVENFAPCWPEFDIEKHTGVKITKGIYQQDIGDTDTCPYIFYGYSVNADGLVSSCFLDWGRKLVIGDVREQSMKQIWNSDRMNALRLQHLEGRRRQNGVCGNCGQLSHCLPDNIDAHRPLLLAKFKTLVPDQPGRAGARAGSTAKSHRRGRMKILHVTPHLGGGVGKAHAAIARGAARRGGRADFRPARSTARPPLRGRDRGRRRARRRRRRSRSTSADLRAWPTSSSSNSGTIRGCSNAWRAAAFRAMRSVFWSHISGLARPVIQPGLIEQAGRFVFTTEASAAIRSLAMLPAASRRKTRCHQQRLRLCRCRPGASLRATERRSSRISAPSIS